MSDQDLERVREILVGELRESLKSVQDKFEPEAFSELVASVVAEALASRAKKDDKVAGVLAPTIDQAISSSIDQDPKKLAESLYPIMGPAIRKSISETLQQMLENFNQLLEESLSPKSLRWRFDAWRTGRSYSELVMLNTLEYRIEQVFLIHRETSLLIQHQVSDLTDSKDPDMVSSMFSAIQDFIEDSFSTDDTNELNTLRLGDLTVVIQRGPSAVIAAVARGRVPEDLRASMVLLLESLHSKKRAELHDYSGDPNDFIEFEPDVRQLLQAEKKQQEEKKKFPWLAVVSILVIAAALGYWQWLGMEINKEQRDLVRLVEQQPGITILEKALSRESLRLKLMVDPDAVEPDKVLGPASEKFALEVSQTAYLSLQAEILERRTKRILMPAAGTELEIVDRSIQASGTATVDWLKQAEQSWTGITGAEAFHTDKLNLTDPAKERIDTLVMRLESFVFEFDKGDAEIDPETTRFLTLVDDIKTLLQQANDYGTALQIDIVGFTDASGTDRVNRIVGLQRAETLMASLIDNGIPGEILNAFRSQDYAAMEDETSRETRLVVKMAAQN